MRLAARTLIAMAAAMLASCSLFVDTSGLSSGSRDAGASDAANGGDSAGSADGGPVGCSETIVDSFDTGPLGALWDSFQADGLMGSLDATDVRSPPNALLISQPANVGGHAYLTKSAPRGKSACCEVSMKNDSIYSTFFGFTGISGNFRIAVTGNTLAEGFYPGEDAGPGINRIDGSLPFDSANWHRMRVEAQLPAAAGQGSVRVTIDGAPALTAKIGDDAYDLSFDSIIVGTYYAQGDANAHETRFDDVSCAIH